MFGVSAPLEMTRLTDGYHESALSRPSNGAACLRVVIQGCCTDDDGMLECDLTFSIRASIYKRNSMNVYIDTQRWSKQPVTNARQHPIAVPHRSGDKLAPTPQDVWYQHLRLCQYTSSSSLADARPHGLHLCWWPPLRRRGSGVPIRVAREDTPSHTPPQHLDLQPL